MPIATRITGEPQPDGRQRLPTVLAECQASRQLLLELERYCDGRVKGRSMLLAGYRGAGKTMMVDNSLMRVGNRTRNGGEPLMRPLPITLLGPNLLPNDSTPEAKPAARRPGVSIDVHMNPAAAAPPPKKDADDDARLRQRLLESAVLGMHAALSRELVQCLRERARPAPQTFGGGCAELAAQLAIELTEAPPPSRLREFWERAGAFEHGLLFPQRQRPGQGLSELVALTGLGYAYQRVSGELRENNEDKRSDSVENAQAAGWEASGAEAAKPLVALVAGGAVATAGAAAGSSWSLLLGLATTLFAGAFFRFTRKTESRRERKVDRTFLPDTQAETLDRVLPGLIQRLKDAGLAPVFVVDELDKVDDLWQRITPLLDHFKKMFAESVFTCLLVSRDFSEALRIQQQVEPMGRQFSYFSHRLFVIFEPAEIHDYLGDWLELVDG